MSDPGDPDVTVPSTYPEDAPVIAPMRILHQGRVHTLVRGHVRRGAPVRHHWRDTSGNASNPDAPFTNPGERDTLPGGKVSI